MKSNEFIQAAAEFLGALGGSSSPQQVQPNRAVMTPVQADNTDNTEAGVFVAPLQAKLELLKKAVNVDSIYDEQGEDSDMTGHGADNEDDELDQIKKLSGISAVVVDEAGSDEPLDV
jgi:hypothetical protein